MIEKASTALWVQRLLRAVVAAVFIVAAVQKIPDPKAFARNVEYFKLLPLWAANPVAMILPWVELVTALVLLLGLWVPEAVGVFFVMSLGFEFGAIRAMVMGFPIDCGCFGKDYKGSAIEVIILNAVLIAMYLIILYTVVVPRRTPADAAAPRVIPASEPPGGAS